MSSRNRSWGRVAAATGGAPFGLVVCLPVGSETCQAPVGGSCPTEVITPIGLSFITFPWWMPVAGLVMGGLAGWSLVAATQYLARR